MYRQCQIDSGTTEQFKEVAPYVKWIHSSIHCETLAVKKMLMDLKSVLDSAIKVVKLIKSRPMNSHLFRVLCNEMGSEQLLLHTEARWFSRGKVLTRLYVGHFKLQIF